ncbi:integral membrane protein [Pseudohyphozyma bogoriensis]|nr:integral membrane protein [Pseudohyphozyma bogoriensis]
MSLTKRMIWSSFVGYLAISFRFLYIWREHPPLTSRPFRALTPSSTVFCDVLNVVAIVRLGAQLTQKLLAGWYLLGDGVLLFQLFWYGSNEFGAPRAFLAGKQRTRIRQRTDKEKATMAHIGQWTTLQLVTLVVVVTLGCMAWWGGYIVLNQYLDDNFTIESPTSASTESLALGYISQFLYGVALFAELYRGWKKAFQKVQEKPDTSVIFWFLLAGNILSIISICILAPFSLDAYYMAQMPWLAGPAFCVVMDLTLLGSAQFYWQKWWEASPEGQAEQARLDAENKEIAAMEAQIEARKMDYDEQEFDAEHEAKMTAIKNRPRAEKSTRRQKKLDKLLEDSEEEYRAYRELFPLSSRPGNGVTSATAVPTGEVKVPPKRPLTDPHSDESEEDSEPDADAEQRSLWLSPGRRRRNWQQLDARTRALLASADPSTAVFLRTFALGYVVETALPVVRVVVRIARARRADSVRNAVKTLLWVLLQGLRPRGMAVAMGTAIGGARWGESRVEGVVRAAVKRVRTTLQSSGTAAGEEADLERGDGEGSDEQGKEDRMVAVLSTLEDYVVLSVNCLSQKAILSLKPPSSGFYLPERLPPSYNRWIASLSRIDPSLLTLLRDARANRWVYGKAPDDTVRKMCEGIAARAGRPVSEVNPHHNKRLDCRFIHGTTGGYDSACEVNAARRWGRAFLDALAIYFPVHFLPHLLFGFRGLVKSPVDVMTKILVSTSRSSAFLATFVASIFASVCLNVPQQLWDSGLCTGLGCFVCGFSVLIENRHRRKEMFLFVAPRALYSLLDDVAPEVMTHGRLGEFLSTWVERWLFAISSGVLTSTAVHRPELVSGVLRGAMKLAVGDWGRTKASVV